ncbi:disease resistance protein RUN1 isoform X1 [Helianthus annuus]|nr:disease resistance protein RUN1 isoform X1 [Helianthus annuus]XP_035840757.1 disease resistance protein RUN1 isoform X1 [Helianthus annuus]
MKKLRCLKVKNDEFLFDLKENEVKGLVDKSWYFFRRFWKHNKVGLYFPNSLQYLHWKGYPHRCLPKTFEANNLVAFKMPWSKIKQLWEGEKVMKKLKFLDLSYSIELRSLDLGLTPNLERLDVGGCEKLVKLDMHGGCLKTLVFLNLNRCRRLKSISFIKQMESLEVLRTGRLYLREFHDYIFTGHSSLLELDLSLNYIEEIPSSIGNLEKLVSLDLKWCWELKSVPGSICRLQHLRTLNLGNSGIEELPEDLGQLECLENLYLSSTKVKHLPGSICMLKHLKTLDLSWCKLLVKLPEDVGQLESLEILHLLYCYELREIPKSICKLKCLKELSLFKCRGLEKLPDELGNLKCLQYLEVWGSGITQLPQSIYSVKGLKFERHRREEHLFSERFEI